MSIRLSSVKCVLLAESTLDVQHTVVGANTCRLTVWEVSAIYMWDALDLIG